MWHRPTHHQNHAATAVIEVGALLGSPADRELVERCAKDTPWQLSLADNVEGAIANLTSHNIGTFILDRDCVEFDWRRSVERLAKTSASPSVLLASHVVDHYLFEEVVRYGGFDVVAKPIETEPFLRVARLAIAYWKSRHAVPIHR